MWSRLRVRMVRSKRKAAQRWVRSMPSNAASNRAKSCLASADRCVRLGTQSMGDSKTWVSTSPPRGRARYAWSDTLTTKCVLTLGEPRQNQQSGTVCDGAAGLPRAHPIDTARPLTTNPPPAPPAPPASSTARRAAWWLANSTNA